MSDYLDGSVMSPSVINSRLQPHQTVLEAFDEDESIEEKTAGIHHVLSLVKADLNSTRELRRTKSEVLSAKEKGQLDQQIELTEKVVVSVDALMKPARTDLISRQQITSGTARFVLMDEVEVRSRLKRLSAAHTGLITAKVLLASTAGGSDSLDEVEASRNPRRRNSTDTMSTMTIPEPPYSLEETGQSWTGRSGGLS